MNKTDAINLATRIAQSSDCLNRDPNPYCEECIAKTKDKICPKYQNYMKLVEYLLNYKVEEK